MKKIGILIFVILGVLILFTWDRETHYEHADATQTPKKTYLDTPVNTYKNQIEAQNIANTLQAPSSSYLNSRVNARVDAKNAVQQGNQQMEAQDKALEAFTK